MSAMRLLAVVAALFCLATPALAAGPCEWADAMDPAAPPGDAGRGISDWTAHQDYVVNGIGLTNAHTLVGARVATLAGCLEKDQFAHLYADLSLLIAQYGRTGAGWVNQVDTTAPADDQGRGIAAWQPHADYVLKGVGLKTAQKLIADRLQTLSTKLPKPIYARVYADVSIFIANYARIASGK